jgi:hypothetical protein
MKYKLSEYPIKRYYRGYFHSTYYQYFNIYLQAVSIIKITSALNMFNSLKNA